jgi:hypothetical protein
MDATRFDALTRVLSGSPSRRRLLAVLPLTPLAELPGAAPATAKRHHKHKNKHKHRHQSKPFCAGRNSCTHSSRESACNAPGSIPRYCMRTAETHEPVCVGAVGSFDCTACPPGDVCVDLVGCSPNSDSGCARPCANPR